MHSRQLLILCSVLLMLMGGAIMPASMAPQANIVMHDDAVFSQGGSYDGTIPMNSCVFVGDVVNDYQTALSYLAAVPLSIRSNTTHMTSALLLPDTDAYETPLEEWLALADYAMQEAIYIGDVSNPDFISAGGFADNTYYIDGENYFDVAAEIAVQFFGGTSQVVLVEANPTIRYNNDTLYDTSNVLSGLSTTYMSGTTSQSNDWEWFGNYNPTGGGAIFTLENGDEYIWFDLLAREDGEYYPLDFPYLDGESVRFPYTDRPGEQWVLHAIDLYNYVRTVYLDIRVQVPQAEFYSFTVEPGEDCVIDFEVDVTTEAAVGMNVLGPSGDLVLSANRFALFSEYGDTTGFSATLAHPAPGTYQAYVYNAESHSVGYSIEITKKVIMEDWREAGASAANGASIASALGAPLLYYNSDGLSPYTLGALTILQPERAVVVKPMGTHVYDIGSHLHDLEIQPTMLDSFGEIQSYLEVLHTQGPPLGVGDLVVYDGDGTFFSSAGLAATQRRTVAVPFDYDDSGLMTLSQIPEQLNWMREYTMPLASTFSILDVWTSSGRLSGMNPPFESMRDIANAFYQWVTETTGITNLQTTITIAPYRGFGDTLAPTFERAIAGRTKPGRYPSGENSATLVQLMRNILRVPLQTAPSRSLVGLGTHLVYSHFAGVETNTRSTVYVANSENFPTYMTDAGLVPDQEVGPQVIAELALSPYFWLASTHGGVGGEGYDIEGIAALLNGDAYRGYDEGAYPFDPDQDDDGVVNPPESYITGYNVSDFVTGVDLNGMFAYFDSCQLASSYAPATMMEAGCDAVVACRVDALIGASDLFEMRVMESMSAWEMSLGAAMNGAYGINSHVYSTGSEGVDTYATSSTVGVVGASCIQFIIYGDPDVTLYDHSKTAAPFANREGGIGPGHTVRAHPGTSYELPIGPHDPVGNVFAKEGDYTVEVYSPTDTLLVSDSVHCTNQSLGGFVYNISVSDPLGLYRVEITDSATLEEYTFGILLEWPVLEVVYLETSQLSQFGYWTIDISVVNPHVVYADTAMTVYVGGQVIASMDVEWAPGYSEQSVSLEAAFMPYGTPEINVVMVLTVSSAQCCSYTSTLSISLHWISIVLYGILPVLGVAVVIFGLLAQRSMKKNSLLHTALEKEVEEEYEEAFNTYMDLDLLEGGIRTAVKAGFTEKVLERVMQARNPQVNAILAESARGLYDRGEFLLAGRVFASIGDTQAQTQSNIMHSFETGDVSNAAVLMKGLLTSGHQALASVMLLESHTSGIAGKLMEAIGSPMLGLADYMVRQNQPYQPLLDSIQDIEDDSLRLSLWVSFVASDRVLREILEAPSVGDMVAKTNFLTGNTRDAIASEVVAELAKGKNSTKIRDYLSGIGMNIASFSVLTRGVVDQLMDSPSNKTMRNLLSTLAKEVPGSDAYTAEVFEVLELLEGGDSSKAAAIDGSRTLDLMATVANPAVVEKLVGRLHRNRFGSGSPDSLGVSDLGEYTLALRYAALAAPRPVSEVIERELSEVEPVLRQKIKQQARSVLLEVDFKPESSWSTHSTVERLIIQNVDRTNPFATIDALAEAAGETGFPELEQLVANTMNDDESVRAFVRRAANDPRIRQKLARGQAVQLGGLHVPLSNEQVLASIAREEWSAKAAYAWKNGVQASAYGVLSTVLSNVDKTRANWLEEATSLICRYVAHLNARRLYHKSGTSAAIRYLCDAAGLTPVQERSLRDQCGG